MITRDDYFMDRDKLYPPSEEVERNAAELLIKANRLISYCPLEFVFIVSSGYRPEAINRAVANAAKKSLHISGDAIDFGDGRGDIDNWCLKNLDLMKECGLYLESPSHTPQWSHWQQVPPRSGKRVFIP